MKYSPEAIIKAAQAIRPFISELLDAPNAQRLDQQLENLLGHASSDQDNYRQLNSILTAHEETGEWIRLYLEEQYPAETILDALRVYYPLRGLRHSVKSPRYVCPVEFCHQDWYRRDLAEDIPHCPVHDLQLIIDS